MSDLIDRQAAIDALHTWFRDGFEEDKWWNSTHVLTALEGVPSAQPERKRGRWVKQTDENCWWYECSECGDYPMKNAYGHEELSVYCPHCGAMMVEGEEE